jgi:hypothetical protein
MVRCTTSIADDRTVSLDNNATNPMLQKTSAAHASRRKMREDLTIRPFRECLASILSLILSVV